MKLPLLKKYQTKTTKTDRKVSGFNERLLVEIFQHDEEGNETKIGEYQRNYMALYNTFYPFWQNDQEYALYSKHYEETRIMTLPDCKDLCGEPEPGFCPTGYYVPYEVFGLDNWEKDKEEREKVPDEDRKYIDNNIVDLYYDYVGVDEIEPASQRKEGNSTIYSPAKYKSHKWVKHPERLGQYGFVSGCHWGDDSSWKIQYIDLSKLSEGSFTIDNRFGYVVMPENVNSLKECIHLSESEYIQISEMRTYNRITGKHEDFEDE